MNDYKIDLMQLANKALEDAAKGVLRQMFGEAGEWAMNDKLREAVREKAKEILKEPEIVELLRQRIKQYIASAESMGDKDNRRY